MKLYIIRHGETVWNTEGRLQGWKNSDLTENGIQAAKNLRDRFDEEKIKFDKIYTSTQKRAIDTAKIIDDKQEIIQLEELKEIGFGPWEGMTIDDINKKYNNGFDTYVNKSHLYEPLGDGESFSDVFKRVKVALERIINSEAENVLIVSHGVTIKVMTAIIKNVPLEKFYTLPIHKGTALNICRVEDGKISFIVEGDTKHMGGA